MRYRMVYASIGYILTATLASITNKYCYNQYCLRDIFLYGEICQKLYNELFLNYELKFFRAPKLIPSFFRNNISHSHAT